MKKLITCLTVLFCLITASVGGYTAKEFLGETDSVSRKVYSAAVVSGIYTGYMRSAKVLNIPQEYIDACIEHTSNFEANFGSYDEMVADMMIYMVVKDSDLAESDVEKLVSVVLLSREKCYPKKDQEL